MAKKQEAMKKDTGPPELSDVQEDTQETPDDQVQEPTAGGEADIEEAITSSKAPPKLTIEDRVHNLEIKLDRLDRRLERKIGLSRPLTPEEASNAAEQSALSDERKQMIDAERELRKYIKRGSPKEPDKPGGFRKGLSASQRSRAKSLMKALGRKLPKYDLSLIP